MVQKSKSQDTWYLSVVAVEAAPDLEPMFFITWNEFYLWLKECPQETHLFMCKIEACVPRLCFDR